MTILNLFEDHTTTDFIPLADARPVFDLRCGAFTLRERIGSFFPDHKPHLWLREEIREAVGEQYPDIPVFSAETPFQTPPDAPERFSLYVNGRVIMDARLARELTPEGPERLFMKGDTLVAARMAGSRWSALYASLMTGTPAPESMDRREVAAAVVDYPWNLIERNACQIVEDCARLPGSAVVPSEYPGVYFMNERDIVLGAGVVLMPGVVLDADEGPVRIGAGTRILPHTYIQGPVSIGDHVLVQAGSHIHAGVTIGPVCKIGGEVTASIVSGYSNKQHHGFLGHAYTGQWVNLGAGTTNSNLKNTYGSVSMLIKGRRIDTGMMFMGALLGDFSRTAINTSLNTGTIVGFSSHIVFPGFPPKYIPPFHWLTEKGLVPFETTGALKVAERMMARRRITMGTAERTRFLRLAEEAAKEGKTP